MADRFDAKYDIRLAVYEEIPDVMLFIDTYWKKGHILAVNREFFEYEMVVDDVVNFLIAKNRETGVIEGVLGYLPCSKDKEKLDLWGVIWKTVPGAMPMLGMELKKRLFVVAGARTDLGVGANSGTSVPLLGRILHYYTGKMKHYYRLSDLPDYRIAKITDKVIPESRQPDGLEAVELNSIGELEEFFDFSSVSDNIPYKDSWYYNRRFYEHPVYRYKLWGLSRGSDRAVMVTRIQECMGSSVVRIVDYLGEQGLFAYCGRFIDGLIQGSEYADFYFDGFDEEHVKAAGFTEAGENIIPDYFSPFEQVNVDIYVDSSNNKDKCLFFKADGDQDRPS